MKRNVLWLTAAVLFVAGCSQSSGHKAAAEPQLDPRPLGGAVHFTAAEAAALHRAEEHNVQKCMKKHGFDYRTVPVGDVQGAAAASRYGLLTPRRAAQDGYGLIAQRLSKTPSDPNARPFAGLSETDRRAWEERLKGAVDGPKQEIRLPDGLTVTIAPDSCVSVARQELYGPDWDQQYYTLQGLSNSIADDTLDHPLVTAAERKWVTCMRDEGFRYRDRNDPLKALKKQVDAAGTDSAALQAAGKEELRLATHDATCQTEADLAEQVARAQQQVERNLASSATTILTSYRAALNAALKRATAA
ncbi:hypothetical protein ACGFOM_28760 [Streptomyces sp. NPDC048594]|uniref:hypothetical protein n=1 Tax=Streptomyces sp. NPDC048594 TaxID=3365575 RepID=UPI003723E316